MDPKHLYYLSEIVRYGSLSRASERLGVVQPTLTRVVKILEAQAGAPLLNRGRYGVSPTEIGERIAAAGESIAAQVDVATEAVDQWKSGIGQELRVGIGPMLALSVMSGFLEGYLAKQWPYLLKVTTATAGRLVDRLNADELDVVLAPSRISLHQEKLTQETVLEDQMAIYAGLKSPLLARNGPLGQKDLVGQKWAVVGARSNIYESQGDLFGHMNLPGVVPKLTFTGDISMCLTILSKTDILVPLPERLADACGQIQARQKLPTDIPKAPRNVALWTTKANKDRPQVIHFRRQILDWLSKIFD